MSDCILNTLHNILITLMGLRGTFVFFRSSELKAQDELL